MENRSHALAAGVFVVLLTALLLAMAVWLMHDSRSQRLFEISSSQGVTGLQRQAAVRYKGVPVGRVVAVSLDSQARGNVLIRIALNDEVPVSTATYASLGFQGVTGQAFVQLDDDASVADAMPALSTGGHVPRIPMRPGMLARWTEQGEHMLGQLSEASARMNLLLAAENQDQLMRAVHNLGQAAANLQQLTAHVDRALIGRHGEVPLDLPLLQQQAQSSLAAMQATAQRLGTSAEAVRNAAVEFHKVSVRMTESGGTLERIARSAEALNEGGQALTTNLVPRLSHTADDAARTVRQVGRVANLVADNPQSLLLGTGAAAPGPGEAGFVAPSATPPWDQHAPTE